MGRKRIALFMMAVLMSCTIHLEGLATGWVKSDKPSAEAGLQSGWWYYLDQGSWYAAPEGQLVAWHWIDGNGDGIAECYAFNANGWMYSDTITPDGYEVNANGAWIVNGIVQTKQIQGIGHVQRTSSGGGGGGSSSGGSHKPQGDKEPEEEKPQKELYQYTIQLIDESGNLLREIKGEGESGSRLNVGSYKVDGYSLAENQILEVVLEEDGGVFTVVYQKEDIQEPTEPENETLYNYKINYVDIEEDTILATQIGKAASGTVIEIDHPEIEGYRICPDQRTTFTVHADKIIQMIYYEKIPVASPSEAQEIAWTIHFTEKDRPDKKIWPSQSGKMIVGGVLSVNFPQEICDVQGNLWESLEEPPIERVIEGPEAYLEYIEFVCTGTVAPEPDPDQDEKERLRTYLETAKECEAERTGENPDEIPDSRFLVQNQIENNERVRTVAHQIQDTEEHAFYVIGKNFVPNGQTIAEWFGEDAVYSNLLEKVIHIGEDTYYVARMGIKRSYPISGDLHMWEKTGEVEAFCLEKGKIIYEDQLTGEIRQVTLPPLGHEDKDGDQICDRCQAPAEDEDVKMHWNIGDIQAREIDGVYYMFRCIDQNYSDGATQKQMALFLAETVIPANYGSDYHLKEMADGSHKYVFEAGPIVNFGDSSDYKYSKIRKWLSQEDLYGTEAVSIGNDYAYMGSTPIMEYASFDSNDLKAYYIGDQQLKEQIFILSVDEAVKYREELWRFEGSEEDNPESQYAAFSKGYWLRSPMGTAGNYDTDYVYVVDLVNGNIHPAEIKPSSGRGDDELDVTTVYGLRLAFTMLQD